MIIGVPKEVKIEEHRVSAPPKAAGVLVKAGHQVLVQTTAGEGIGFADEDYIDSGATVVKTIEELYERAEMIYQIKEPLVGEFPLLRKGQIHYRYFHLAANEKLARVLMEKGITAVAFEMIETPDGGSPCLDPMSDIAGRLSAQIGAQFLGRIDDGYGKVLGGDSGVAQANVVVVGCGVVGATAAQKALNLGARVTVLDVDASRLSYLKEGLKGPLETLISNPDNVSRVVKDADLLIGAVRVKGGKAPVVVTRDMVNTMKKGSVIVDVAIDQGGCVETSHPTSLNDPIFIVHGVIHYCVTNIPGVAPRTSAISLSNATLPYALKLADKGYREAVRADESLRKGLSIWNGKVTNKIVADALGFEYTPFQP